MVLQPGEGWGSTGALPEGATVAGDDRTASRLVERAVEAGAALPVIGLVGGDLRRTLGGRRDAAGLRRDDATVVTVDVGVVEAGGRRWCFVAHAVARRPAWHGPFLAVMSAEWLGDWDMAPRAHPGDGFLDVVEGALPWGQRLQARNRVRTGTHLPHPALRASRRRTLDVDLGRPTPLRIDGERVGTVGAVAVTLLPRALTVVV